MGGINHQKWVVYYCYTHIITHPESPIEKRLSAHGSNLACRASGGSGGEGIRRQSSELGAAWCSLVQLGAAWCSLVQLAPGLLTFC